MKNKIIICTFFSLVAATATIAQNTTEAMVIKQNAWTGTTFIQDGKSFTFKEVSVLMQDNPLAYESIKKARNNNTFGTVLAALGGAFVGWPLGTALAGGEANWGMVAIGAGLIVVAIPIYNTANRHAHNAVQYYNEGVRPPQSSNVSVNLGTSPNGIGLQINF
ncbi:MAG: hypothetical protein FWG79_04725 [Bacteroidales bacterium]|nr:hypothetical protein [Bacteroidales bacterium]